jgi:hypothetical protein
MKFVVFQYFVFLFLLLCAELVVAVTTLVYREHFLTGLENRIMNRFKDDYGGRDSIFTQAVEQVQFTVSVSCTPRATYCHLVVHHIHTIPVALEYWLFKLSYAEPRSSTGNFQAFRKLMSFIMSLVNVNWRILIPFFSCPSFCIIGDRVLAFSV